MTAFVLRALHRPRVKSALFALGAALSLLGARPASAEPTAADVATAEALYQRARMLMKDGKLAEACPMLAESQRLDPASGTLLKLAECYEGEGRTASAWLTLQQVRAIAEVEKRPERAARAREAIAEISKKLSYLTVSLGPAALAVEGVEIRRDDAVLGKAALGVPVPVDPGTHEVTVTAPGYVTRKIPIQVGPDGDRKEALVDALEAERAAAHAPPPPAPEGPPRAAAPSPPTHADAEGGGTGRTVGLVLGGVGIAGIAVGSVFGIAAKSSDDRATTLCRSSPCSNQEGLDANSRSITEANVANVGVGAGAALLVAGIVTYVVSAPARPDAGASPAAALAAPRARARLSLRVTAFDGQLGVGGEL